MLKAIFSRYFELIFWLSSLVLLSQTSPAGNSHYSLCLFKIVGLHFCPGCGLGRSIAYLFHGKFTASFSSHPLGLFALAVIICRMYNLLPIKYISQENKNQLWNKITGLRSTLFFLNTYMTLPEELVTINSHTKGFSDDELTHFCMIYRSKRKDPQTILILCLLGLVMVAGIHRFVIGQTGMGILYFFTGGLCLVGTIIDAINYKNLALEYNAKMISETLMMLNMIKR